MSEFKEGDLVKVNAAINEDSFEYGATDNILQWQRYETVLRINRVVPQEDDYDKVYAGVVEDEYEYAFRSNELVHVKSAYMVDNEILNAHEAAFAWGNGEKLEYKPYLDTAWIAVDPNEFKFSDGIRYRRAKRTITVNGHEVPEPMKDEPTYDTIYYVPDPKAPLEPWAMGGGCELIYQSILFRNGLCHDNREAAITHGEALADKGEES